MQPSPSSPPLVPRHFVRVPRVRPSLAAVALLSACAAEPSGPPSGFPVSLDRATAAGPPGPPTITAAGDSVMAEATLGTSGCNDYDAVAGTRAGALVVTIVETEEANRACLGVLVPVRFRVVTRRAPLGTYVVLLEQRTRRLGGREERPVELARGVVTLR